MGRPHNNPHPQSIQCNSFFNNQTIAKPQNPAHTDTQKQLHTLHTQAPHKEDDSCSPSIQDYLDPWLN